MTGRFAQKQKTLVFHFTKLQMEIYLHTFLEHIQLTYFVPLVSFYNIYFFKVNNINTRKRCEICSKLTMKTPERRNFEHISHLSLVFLLLTLNR